ncbi:hypothetical protein AKO1_005837 [Acrasis kona]|uniref:Uncharacterized protein n=1 Tax=Acrasis kona TaxID=1008807 RepID=A0AAW2YIH1_9EUKA
MNTRLILLFLGVIILFAHGQFIPSTRRPVKPLSLSALLAENVEEAEVDMIVKRVIEKQEKEY